MRKTAVLPLFFLLTLPGCVVTREDDMRTGLFENNIRELIKAFDKTKHGQTKEEIERLGFNFSAYNIKSLPGVDALREIYGEEGWREILRGISWSAENAAERNDKILEAFNAYVLYIIPYRLVITKEDRIYLNKKEIKIKGDDLTIKFLFKKDKLIYKTHSYVRLDEEKVEKAFLLGLIKLAEGSSRAADIWKRR